MLSGRVLIDLRQLDEDKARGRVASLIDVPDGVRVEIIVGSVLANPAVAWFLSEHRQRLAIDVVGDHHVVQRWLALIRDPDVLSWGA